MRKALWVSVTAGFVIFGAVSAWATGNGAPSGAHYNLNIICVPQAKTADMTDTQGHTIFVPCEGATKIYLIEGEDFAVLDRNGTDANGASFQLPPTDTGVITDEPGVQDECTLYNADGTVDEDGVPDAGDYYVCGTGTSVWSVFARALGNPGGTVVVMLCGTTDDGIDVCSTANQLTLGARRRPPKFENVTANLLYLYNVTIDGVLYKRIPLFSDVLQDYFWSYDNHGLKLLQLRFYHCTTLVPGDWPGEIDDSACFAK
jgi:hypothetical protein